MPVETLWLKDIPLILPLHNGRTDQTLWASHTPGDKSRLNFLNLVVSIPFERWPFNKYCYLSCYCMGLFCMLMLCKSITPSLGNRVGRMVRVLTFHQCYFGFNFGLDAICGWCLLLLSCVLYLQRHVIHHFFTFSLPDKRAWITLRLKWSDCYRYSYFCCYIVS